MVDVSQARTQSTFVPLAVATLLCGLASAAQAQPAPDAGPSMDPAVISTAPESTWPVVERVGDTRIEAGRTLRLELGKSQPAELHRWSRLVFHQVASGVPMPSTTATTQPISLELHWSDPMGPDRQLSISDGVIDVEVQAGPERTARYHLVWRAPDRAFEFRVPASPDRYRVEVVPPQATRVLSGPGCFGKVVFGEQVEIPLLLSDTAGVSESTLYWRRPPAVPYQTAPCVGQGGASQRSAWLGTIPRPDGLQVTLEYHVRIVNRAGVVTSYGTAELPHRIQLLDPTENQ